MDAVEFFKTVKGCAKIKAAMDAPFVKIIHVWSRSWLESTGLQMKALKKRFQKLSNGEKTIQSIPARASF